MTAKLFMKIMKVAPLKNCHHAVCVALLEDSVKSASPSHAIWSSTDVSWSDRGVSVD